MNRPRHLVRRFFGAAFGDELVETPLPEDLVRWVSAHFSAQDREAALACLRQAVNLTGEPASPRFLRCAALSSGGDLQRLQQQIAQLRIDWRNVIMAAEFSVRHNKVYRARDLGKPIPMPEAAAPAA
jgi:hypothetical protein